MCSEPILEGLVEPSHTTIGLRVAYDSSDMFDPHPLHKGNKIRRDKLGHIISVDDVRHIPAGKQVGKEVGDNPGGDRPRGQNLGTFGVEVLGYQEEACGSMGLAATAGAAKTEVVVGRTYSWRGKLYSLSPMSPHHGQCLATKPSPCSVA